MTADVQPQRPVLSQLQLEGYKPRYKNLLLRVGGFCLLAVFLTSCAKTSGSNSGGLNTPLPANATLSGNWEFQSGTKGAPFTILSGYLNEQAGIAGSSHFTEVSLQVQSNSCFSNSKVLDFEGYAQSSTLSLSSFPSYAQVVTLGLSTQCTNGVNLCGSYAVSGGCADTAQGQVTGVQYATFTGTLQSPSSMTPSLQLAISQQVDGNGQGGFPVSGTLLFTGTQCLTKATIISAQSYLTGSILHLVATTNSANSAQLTLDGLINTAASTVSIDSLSLAGSTCVVPLAGTTITK